MLKKYVVKCSILGNKGTLLRGNCHFMVMNDHFGGPSVHCGQILHKNPGKGQSPPPPFWVHMVPQPIPKPRNLSHSSVPPTHEHGGHVHVADHSSSI